MVGLSNRDRDLLVGCPQPVVLHIQARSAGSDVHVHVGSDAACIIRRGRSWALRNLQVATQEATYTGVHIPHTGRGAGSVEIPLDKGCASLRALGGDNHVGPLDLATLTGSANLDHWLRVAHVGKEGAAAHDDGKSFAHQLGVGWNGEGLGDLVSARIEEHDLSGRCSGVDGVLQRGGVVCGSVTFGTGRPGRREARDGEGLVLGLGTSVVVAATDKRSGAVVGSDGSFEVSRAGRSVFMALTPASDGGRAASQGGAAVVLDSNGNVVQNNILEDNTAGCGRRGRAGEGRLDTDGSVGDGAVEENDGSHGLCGAAARGDVDTHLAAADGQARVAETPIPVV